MKHRLPRGQELLLLAALSVFCTLVVSLSGQHDAALAFLAAPLFVVAAVLGLRRSAEAQPVPDSGDRSDVDKSA